MIIFGALGGVPPTLMTDCRRDDGSLSATFIWQHDPYRPVSISSRLPNSPLFLIWEIILKLQIESSSARDLTSKLETRARDICLAFAHSASLRAGEDASDQIAGYFAN